MYNHFDGQGRAPPGVNTDDKSGKCPLYDESHKRKDQQVDKAEKEAMAKVRAENPDLSEEDLKIKFAKGLQSSSNRHHGDHRHQVPMGFHHNHHRQHGHGMREADVAALYHRVPGAAFHAMFEGVGNVLDGGIPPQAVQQAQEQGRHAREPMRGPLPQHIQLQMQRQRHVSLQQQQQALHQQQQAALRQQQALGEDYLRHIEQQVRRTAELNHSAQTHGARMPAANDHVFQPFGNGLQAVEFLRQRHNNRAFGNNAGASVQDDARARRQPNGAHRILEDRSHRLGGGGNPDPPTQGRNVNDFRRRAAEINVERIAEPIAEWRRFPPNPFDPDPPPRLPVAFPQAPRRTGHVPPEAPNPWVAGANDQAYL